MMDGGVSIMDGGVRIKVGEEGKEGEKQKSTAPFFCMAGVEGWWQNPWRTLTLFAAR
jgi:hypothetical protein